MARGNRVVKAALKERLDVVSAFVGLTAGLAAFAIAVLVAYSVIAREPGHCRF